MSRAELVKMARHNIAHVQAGTIEQEPDVFRVPVEHYLDPERFRREVERIFKRVPLMLAVAREVAEPGAYKSMDVAGVPVLIARGSDGVLRAFLNVCSHRGAVIVPEGGGRTRNFSCPYHGWTYDESGALVGIASRRDFGEIDLACHGLRPLPVAERAGLVWVTLDPQSAVEIDAFLDGYDALLAHFGFETWHVVSRRTVNGPNWKIAYDGYLDFYHLPVLHKNSFGGNMPNRALYYAWGPHQRVTSPDPRFLRFEELPEDEWDLGEMMNGVWTIFPHVSIATFDAAGPAVLISQLFPGGGPLESTTVQSFLTPTEPDDATREAAEKMADFLEYVVREEDYATGLRQQRALQTGALDAVLFGRNEGGGHCFHRWVERLLALEDDALPGAFAG